MTIPELLLAIYAAACGLLLIVWRHAGRSLCRWIAVIGGVLTLIAIAEGSHRLEVIPMIVVAVIIALIAFRRSRRQNPTAPPRRRILAVLLRCLAALILLLIVVLDAAFIAIFDPISNAPIVEIFGGLETQDFSGDTWTDAFEKLNDHLSRAYALGEWKRIDWKALHDVTAPEIIDAERTQDTAAYYLALRKYLWSLHDGHVNLTGHDGGTRHAAILGGYGLFLIRLDDGRTIAHVLTEGPAARQGIEWGATIIEWNGVPVDEAVARTSVLWYWAPPATNESMRLAQLRLLGRAPVGTNATVVFQNPDEPAKRTATLVSVDDAHETWRLAGPPQSFSLTDINIEWRMLPENIGYVKIRGEIPTLSQLLPDKVVKRAVAEFVRAGAKGVVIDVRGNPGGADKLVPRMMGFFVDAREFYIHTTYYDEMTLGFARHEALSLWTNPREPHFAGPIAVLVDEWCASSCEGLAFIAQKRAAGHVVGFHGTYGSFGISGAEVLMPGGITIEYPGGQSVDEDGKVLLDSDWRLEGGVTPDIRVPLTTDSVRAQFKDGRDVVLEAAVRALIAPSPVQAP